MRVSKTYLRAKNTKIISGSCPVLQITALISGVTAHAGARYPYHRYGTKISGCFPQFG